MRISALDMRPRSTLPKICQARFRVILPVSGRKVGFSKVNLKSNHSGKLPFDLCSFTLHSLTSDDDKMVYESEIQFTL